MAQFSWKDEYTVNMPDIDGQHRRFAAYVDELYELRRRKGSPAEIVRLISELVEYARIHFLTEERYFDMVPYTEADLHRREHAQLTAKLQEFKEKAEGGADLFLAMNLASFLKEWLEGHLAGMDGRFCRLLLNQGPK